MLLYDPPSGWRFGFPKPYRPMADEALEDTLVRDGYPKSSAEFGAKHCRFIGTAEGVAVGGMTAQTKQWDRVARMYVEGCPDDTQAAETFGELLCNYGSDLCVCPPAANDNMRQVAAPATERNGNERVGHYISTLTGRFWPFDPRPEDVDINHIAHSLAMSCRYTGACRRFYSTAEHSVHIAQWLTARGFHPIVALAGLLHDAPETLSGFGDTARPSKVKAPIIKETEERIWDLAVAPAFGLADGGLPIAVHEADSRIIADEMQQNMHEVDPNYTNPLGIQLKYWSPDVAELHFLHTFNQLQDERARAEKMGVAA